MILQPEQQIATIRCKAHSKQPHGSEWRIVGWPLIIAGHEQFRLFIDERATGNPEETEWIVTELSTGFVMAKGDTREAAISMAEGRFERYGDDGVQAVIDKAAKQIATFTN